MDGIWFGTLRYVPKARSRTVSRSIAMPRAWATATISPIIRSMRRTPAGESELGPIRNRVSAEIDDMVPAAASFVQTKASISSITQVGRPAPLTQSATAAKAAGGAEDTWAQQQVQPLSKR